MGRISGRHREEAARLASAVREARRRAKFSQEAVARGAEISVGTVRNIEQCVVTDPGVFQMAAIARVLGTTVDSLLEGGPGEG